MKKFIATIPFQKPEGLKKMKYEAVENKRLQYDKEISFPVLSILNGYTEQGETVDVIVLKHDYENSKQNYDTFEREIQEFSEEKKCVCNVIPIEIPYNDLISTHLDTFGMLIQYMQEGDSVYACMTYGSKPTPIVEMMALNYTYRAKKNTEIGCIAYGQVDFNSQKGKIYDMTPLFYMDEIVKKVADMKVEKPEEVIRRILE